MGTAARNHGYCRECHLEREHERRGKPCRRCGAKKTLGHARQRSKSLCEDCKPFCPTCLVNPRSETSGGYCADCRQQHQRKLQLKRLYGLTLEQWETIHVLQGGACAICVKPFPSLDVLRRDPESRRAVATDHCHATGVVRGLLCNGCNTGIGMLRDSPEVAKRAAKYLSRSS